MKKIIGYIDRFIDGQMSGKDKALGMVLIAMAIGLYGLVNLIIFANGGMAPGCWIHNTTGLNCGTCGVTRQVLWLLRGNMPMAARENIMTFILAIPLGIIYVKQIWLFYTKDKKLKYLDNVLMVGLPAYISFMIIRNIPGFECLAPI